MAFFGVLGAVIFGVLTFIWYARDLPEPGKIVRSEGFSTKIYDRNDSLLYDIFSNQRRTPVELDQIPLYLRQATIAIEDKDFYKHGGFDTKGYLRAIYNIIVHRKLQGGSTLTQQLVKNVLLSSERTVTRKIKEFILTVQIERKYDKDKILLMYLNEAPYGGTAWGVEAASEIYFNKKVSELNMVESAILAGLPQRPSVYSPFSDKPEAYKNRTEQVLRRMREEEYINSDQEKAAKEELSKIKFEGSAASFKAPHFVMYVKKILEDKYGERMVEQGGLKVTTTLDLKLQDKAQEIVSQEIAKVEKVHITNGASLVMDPETGEILAMVGSKNYNDPDYDGKVNVVTSLRQPGSAIKPVTYAAALKKGYTASTLLMDTPTTFPGGIGQPDYKPLNYDGKFHGPMQVRYALGNSLNVPAVKMLAMVGIKDMLSTAYDMGFKTLEPTQENLSRLGLSVTLGGGEVKLIDIVSAYSAFANGGKKVEPVSILKVTDKDGKVLEEYKPTNGKRVLSPEQAFIISNILSDNSARALTFGERSSLNISGYQVGVKTGTTNDKRDNWTVGWTPNIITGVWVGNNDNTAMKEVASGVSGASPIWRRIIMTAFEGRPKKDFDIPGGIVSAEVDAISGFKSHDNFPSRMEFFVKGTEPFGEDTIHAKLKLCKSSGKLATPIDVARGDYDEKEYFVFKENDPTAAKDGENKWQKGINEWLASQSDTRYHPPTENCGTQDQVEVRIKEPQDQSQVSPDFRVLVDPISSNDISFVEIYLNGEMRDSLTSAPYEKFYSLSDGVYTLKARAQDTAGHVGEREIKIGVNVPWDWVPSPTPPPPLSPTPIP
ncbi:MAG: PBP1A family penicillin-binding protein [bacterium]|nr:PBP1A family penicillin-binding protein [bacterium]